MKVQCATCFCIIQVEDDDLGSAMLCGQCQQVVHIPSTYDSPNVLIGEDFIIRRRLGEGGMGAVHLAHQISLDREVALKVLHPQFTRDRDFVLNFVKEARTAAKLNHPNIVQAYAVGEERTHNGSVYYIAMELIEGESVQDILRREGTVGIERSLEIVRDVAAALDHAWLAGNLIHRDIKPDNIMIRAHDGAVKLADLGLAIPAAEVDNDDDEINATPQYLCPENLLGENMDIRGDIYSLGATLFHMLTGQYPFDGDHGIDIARKHISEPLTPPDQIRAEIPKTVSRIVCKMMEKKPDDRYAGPKEVIEAMEFALREIRNPTATTSTGRKRRFKSGGSPNATQVNIVKTDSTQTIRPRTSTLAKTAPATGNGTAVGMKPVVAPPPPANNRKMIIALVAVIVLCAITLVAVFTKKTEKPPVVAPPSPPPTTAATTPGSPSTITPAPVPTTAASSNLDAMIQEVQAYTKAKPTDFDGQYTLWKKIRVEAVGTDKQDMVQAEIERLRLLRR